MQAVPRSIESYSAPFQQKKPSDIGSWPLYVAGFGRQHIIYIRTVDLRPQDN